MTGPYIDFGKRIPCRQVQILDATVDKQGISTPGDVTWTGDGRSPSGYSRLGTQCSWSGSATSSASTRSWTTTAPESTETFLKIRSSR